MFRVFCIIVIVTGMGAVPSFAVQAGPSAQGRARYHTIDDVLRQAGEEEEEKKEERGFYWEGVKVYPYSRRELLAEPWDKYTWHPASPRPDILTTTPTAPSETTSTSAPETTSTTPTPETTSSPLCQLPTEPISDELFRYLRELEDRVEEKDYLPQ
ncbi:unnamed protein product [Sphagnum tenellum]